MKLNMKVSVLTIGLLLLVVGVVSTNNWMTTESTTKIYAGSPSLNDLNRAIASATPLSWDENLEWEKKLGQKLEKQDERGPASIAKNPELLDQMIYGKLAGKYQLQFAQPGYVSEIHFVDGAEASEYPVAIETESFLKDYKSLWAVQFTQFELENKTENEQVYKLQNNKVHVGHARFTFDENHRLTSLKFESK